MTTIQASRVKRDNSNIFRCDDESRQIFRALRKERFKVATPEQLERYVSHCIAQESGTVNPYPDTDLRIDIERFKETLDRDKREVFNLFIGGYCPKQIVAYTKWSLPNVYYKLNRIFGLFREFYGKG